MSMWFRIAVGGMWIVAIVSLYVGIFVELGDGFFMVAKIAVFVLLAGFVYACTRSQNGN